MEWSKFCHDTKGHPPHWRRPFRKANSCKDTAHMNWCFPSCSCFYSNCSQKLEFLAKTKHNGVGNENISEVQNDWLNTCTPWFNTCTPWLNTSCLAMRHGQRVWHGNRAVELIISGEPKPKQASHNQNQNKSKSKNLWSVFFDYCGVVHYEFLPISMKITNEYYLNVMWLMDRKLLNFTIPGCEIHAPAMSRLI